MPMLDGAAEAWLAGRKIPATVRSLVLDIDRAVVFVHAAHEIPGSDAIGDRRSRATCASRTARPSTSCIGSSRANATGTNWRGARSAVS